MHMHNGRANTLTQMEELIVQNYNHPCIAVWGLSNEITAASAVNEELLETTAPSMIWRTSSIRPA